jgi:putative SOS response-associated peptidase YedK
MCRALSILKNQIRQELFEQYELARLVHRRNETAEEEIWFDYAERTKRVIIPAIVDGELGIYEWGDRNGKAKLPKTGWCQKESLEAGKWRWLNPEPVDIPANFGLEKGIWFQIEQGIRGILVRDENEQPHVYMLTERSSHYFEVMTRHDRMPVLIEQKI